MKTGQIGILNVGAGDTRLSFDTDKPEECERAAKILTDMLKRGFAILVQVGTTDEGKPLYTRAEGFDEKTKEYIIAGLPPDMVTMPGAIIEQPRRRGRPPGVRLPAAQTRATAVARSAGG